MCFFSSSIGKKNDDIFFVLKIDIETALWLFVGWFVCLFVCFLFPVVVVVCCALILVPTLHLTEIVAGRRSTELALSVSTARWLVEGRYLRWPREDQEKVSQPSKSVRPRPSSFVSFDTIWNLFTLPQRSRFLVFTDESSLPWRWWRVVKTGGRLYANIDV